MNTIAAILELFWSLFAMFMFCEFGGMVTDRFDKFHNELWQSVEWHMYPAEVQRLYLMFMGNAQQIAFIKGYANIECTRDTFKRVITIHYCDSKRFGF